MSAHNIFPILMPKWGLSMTEGKVVRWTVTEGDTITKNQEILEIETSKIINVYESSKTGVLRRCIAPLSENVPVGSLLGVISEEGVDDGAIDVFVEDFLANFVPPETDGDDAVSLVTVANVDGRKISYMRANEDADGIPVILIHGFGGDGNNWVLNLDALSEGRPVFALDLIGHGASSKDVGDGNLNTLVESVAHFLDALKIDQVHIIGHSLGGAVAILLAARLRKRAASLTCIAPVGLSDKVNPDFLAQYLTAERRRPVKAVLQMLVRDPDLVNMEMVEGFQKYKRLEGSIDAMLLIASNSIPEGNQLHDLRPVLFGLACPNLIIWGAHDQIIDPSAIEGLPDTIAIKIIECSGHLPQLEAADEVNELIKAHIEQIG